MADHGTHHIDFERAMVRLRNQAEDEHWSDSQFSLAVAALKEGYQETRRRVKGREIRTAMVVGVPSVWSDESAALVPDPRCESYEIGDVVLCPLEAVHEWRGLLKVAPATLGDDVTLVGDARVTVEVSRSAKVFLVPDNKIICKIPLDGDMPFL